MMTNLEFYKEELTYIYRHLPLSSDVEYNIKRTFEVFAEKYKIDWTCGEGLFPFVDWLLAEHKEPIKLKRWEKDLLMVFCNYTDSVKLTLDNAIIISPMLRAGYFQGVPNTSMTIKDILDNCEVVDD